MEASSSSKSEKESDEEEGTTRPLLSLTLPPHSSYQVSATLTLMILTLLSFLPWARSLLSELRVERKKGKREREKRKKERPLFRRLAIKTRCSLSSNQPRGVAAASIPRRVAQAARKEMEWKVERGAREERAREHALLFFPSLSF